MACSVFVRPYIPGKISTPRAKQKRRGRFLLVRFLSDKKDGEAMPISLEDHAIMRMAGESNVCLCDEYSHLVLHQAAEIKTLKKKLRIIHEIIDANKIEMVSEELCQGRSNL